MKPEAGLQEVGVRGENFRAFLKHRLRSGPQPQLSAFRPWFLTGTFRAPNYRYNIPAIMKINKAESSACKHVFRVEFVPSRHDSPDADEEPDNDEREDEDANDHE